MSKKIQIIEVQNIAIGISKVKEDDFICLTDMAKAKDSGGTRAADIIKNWVRNRSTLEFLGTWEQLNNPDFKVVEFDHFKMKAGLPSFVLSPGQWVEKTNAIGMYVQSGRYGGTYAHKDIAFEFGSAIKTHILPKSDYTKQTKWIAYAEEADLLNVALFGCTAKRWREANPALAVENKNIRDFASINELTVLSNLESHNAELIKAQINKTKRFQKLRAIAQYQLSILKEQDVMKSLKRMRDDHKHYAKDSEYLKKKHEDAVKFLEKHPIPDEMLNR